MHQQGRDTVGDLNMWMKNLMLFCMETRFKNAHYQDLWTFMSCFAAEPAKLESTPSGEKDAPASTVQPQDTPVS